MSAIIHGSTPVVFGTRDELLFGTNGDLPLKGFPEGRVKIRMRQNQFAKAYVRTASGIKEYLIKIEDGYLMPWGEAHNQNVTYQAQ